MSTLPDREPAEPIFFEPDEPLPFPSRPSNRHSLEAVTISAVLFIATCVSTFFVGMGDPRMPWAERLFNGLSYAGPLMLILLFHEMGHYLQARRYRVPATLPIFLPMPFGPLGTMGAVIVQAAGTANRKAMFDIAVSGPLAGLVIALPVTWWGIQQAQVAVLPDNRPITLLGDPLILKSIVWLIHGPLPENADVMIGSLGYAGWVGILLTGFNLLPIGQLDGGHVMYALIGRKAHLVAMAVLAAWIAYMAITQYWVFLLMVVLLMLFGVKHPPTADDAVPLGPGRVLVGWLTMGLLIVCITPRPFDVHVPKQNAQPAPTVVTDNSTNPDRQGGVLEDAPR